jgi:ADP-ribosyl-[dinitrogen reductase] hydrolase
MVSDDTEHACMVLQSLLEADGDIAVFQQHLARHLRWWLLTLPPGIGLATARAIINLWIGFSPTASGVFSAGNGPAMRSPILGVMLPLNHIAEYVAASSRITHTDPKATWGAIAVALSAHLSSRQTQVDPDEYFSRLQQLLTAEQAGEFLDLIRRAIAAVNEHASSLDFSAKCCSARGVTGYVYQTVPVAIHVWLRHRTNYAAAIEEVIRCGGDTDSTAAIVGGIIGAAVGPVGIPESWQRQLLDWPLSLAWIRRLAGAANTESTKHGQSIPRLPLLGSLARNLFVLPIVLIHGFRRLAPPY